MKKIILYLCIASLCACATTETIVEEPKEEVREEITSLPEKEIVDSPLATESPLNATNIDDYLFLDGLKYVDLRSFNQILSEGAIAGFEVIPFYDVLVWWEKKDNVLFTMKKGENKDTYIGDVGCFFPNYEESEEAIEAIFPKDKQIVFMSTAGVEAAYMINLLKQLGYDASKLYNAGTFTNGVGDTIAYMKYPEHKYYIEPELAYTLEVNFRFGELTPINE